MRRAIAGGCVLGMLLLLAGCDQTPRPFELFLLELDLAVISFLLALAIGALARLTSKHVVVKGQRLSEPRTQEEGEKKRAPKPHLAGRDAKTSLVIALFVSFLVVGALTAAGTIIKKTEYEIPHQKNYFLPQFHMWSFHTIFSEDVYFALMINARLPHAAFEALATDIKQRRFAYLKEESRQREAAGQASIDEDELLQGGRLSPEGLKNLKVGLSMLLTLALFMVPAYIGARMRRGLWLVPILFLALNVLLNIGFYQAGYYDLHGVASSETVVE